MDLDVLAIQMRQAMDTSKAHIERAEPLFAKFEQFMERAEPTLGRVEAQIAMPATTDAGVHLSVVTARMLREFIKEAQPTGNGACLIEELDEALAPFEPNDAASEEPAPDPETEQPAALPPSGTASDGEAAAAGEGMDASTVVEPSAPGAAEQPAADAAQPAEPAPAA